MYENIWMKYHTVYIFIKHMHRHFYPVWRKIMELFKYIYDQKYTYTYSHLLKNALTLKIGCPLYKRILCYKESQKYKNVIE